MPEGTLEAVADAWIDESEGSANHGTGTTMLVRSEASADRRAPVQFDMDQLPSDFLEFTADNLLVKVTVKDPDSDDDRTIELWWYDADFGETSITWDTQPGDEFDGNVGSDTAQNPDQVLSFDLLGFIDQIPTSGPWPLDLRDASEDSTSLLAPFEVSLYTIETDNPPVFEFTYRAENEEDLASQVTPRLEGEADLSSQVLPRIPGEADLDSSVEPWFSEDLTSLVQVRAVPIEDDHAARSVGRVTITLEGALEDVEAIVDEAGTVVHVDGESRRAVVQLVDAVDEPYPAAAASAPARLSRGDAVLFALGDGSAFAPGDRVAWQGLEFRVTGTLDEEQVTDEALFREVGLRRLATVHEARAIGTIVLEAEADLYSEVEVP